MSSKPNERKRSHEERSDVDQAAKKFKFSDEAIAAAEWAEFVQVSRNDEFHFMLVICIISRRLFFYKSLISGFPGYFVVVWRLR